MTTFRVTCRRCGDQYVGADDLVVILAAEPTFAFACPTCGERQRRTCSERVHSILVACGVPALVVGFHPSLWGIPRPFTGEDFDRAVATLRDALTPADLWARP